MVPRYFVLKPPDETFSQELKQMYYVDLNAVITTVTNFRIFQITTTCENIVYCLHKQSLKVYENNRDITACLINLVTAETVIQTPSTVNIPTMPWGMERFSERL